MKTLSHLHLSLLLLFFFISILSLVSRMLLSLICVYVCVRKVWNCLFSFFFQSFFTHRRLLYDCLSLRSGFLLIVCVYIYIYIYVYMYMYILVYGEKRKDDGNVVAQQFCKQVTFSKTVVFFFFYK